MRLSGFAALIVLSLGVTAYATAVYGFLPLGIVVHPEMRSSFETQRLALYTHVFASAVALALGPFQFSSRLRAIYPRLHRWSGRLYLGIGVLVGGLAGLYMAAHAFGGPAARLGFAALAVGWLYTGLRAYLAIRDRQIESHRRWMTRNFALTFAAVTLRLWLPGAMASGIAFELAYAVIAWLSWVPNLLVAERINRTPASPGAGSAFAPDASQLRS